MKNIKSSSGNISRRELLRGAAKLTAGAILMPMVVPASALGKGRSAPSNRIVMGHIGVGNQGTQHVGGGIWTQQGGLVGREDVQVIGVCDVNAQRLENARNIVNTRYNNQACAVYKDYHELLARKDLDGVLIATGERWHPLISMHAAEAGKDVYCEKPLSITIDEALTMRETIRRCGTVLQMGTQQRSSYAFRRACELVRNGYIGDVKEVLIGVGGPAGIRDCRLPAEPVPDWLDYDRWLGPAPFRPYNSNVVFGWMAFRDFSGGEMTNWGTHHYDIAQWGLGMDNSGPVEIIPPDGKDFPTLTYRYANGTLVKRDPDRLARECGENNGVMFIGTTGKVAVWRYDLRTWPESLKKQPARPDEIHLHSCDNHHTDFFNSVRARSRPVSDISVAARTITVCHLGNIAYELGRPIKWDPSKEQFINDPEADRLRSRPMRALWSQLA